MSLTPFLQSIMAVLTEPLVSSRPHGHLPVFKDSQNEDFSGPSIIRQYSAILFDMDGTIIDSTNAIVKHWEKSVSKFASERLAEQNAESVNNTASILQQSWPRHMGDAQ